MHDTILTIGPPLELADVVSPSWPLLADTTLEEALESIRSRGAAALGRPVELAEAVACFDALRADRFRVNLLREPTGFHLCCPFCFGSESDLCLDLGNLDAVCTRCGDQFTVAVAVKELTEALEPWQRLLHHVERMKAENAAG